jgi:acetyl-CoA carboxylase beta subunit
MIFHRDLEKNLRVCSHCGYHLRIGSAERLRMLFDNGEFQSIDLPEASADPLKFRDRRKYTDRLKEAQTKAATLRERISFESLKTMSNEERLQLATEVGPAYLTSLAIVAVSY